MDRIDEFPSRRAHPRFKVTVPVRIRWSEAGTEREIFGLTRDISETGIFIDCSAGPGVAVDVWLEVQLPSLEEPGRSGLHLRSTGKVIRTAGSGEQSGLAVQAKFALAE